MRIEWTLGLSLFALACSASKDDGADPGNDAGGSAPPHPLVERCDGALSLFDLPTDPGARGPWEVGSRAVSIGGLDAEIWYPAAPGSTSGAEKYTYDLRKYLPPEQQATVTESTTILQPCDCYRDTPLDEERGPYPLIIFVHGFSGFSGQSLEQMTHWASRGFVVVSADHPSLGLKTFLASGIAGLTGGVSAGCDLAGAGVQTREAVGVLDALQAPSGDAAFLAGHVDMTRVGAAGHSAGGMAVSSMSQYPGVRVVAPMAAGGVCAAPNLAASLILGGIEDSIVAYTRQSDGFDTTPAPKRLVGLSKAGHMAFTSFCPIGKDEGGILQAAQNAGVTFDPAFLAVVAPLAADGCEATSLPAEAGWAVINAATSAAFEETLLCLPERGAELTGLADRFPDAVGEYREEL